MQCLVLPGPCNKINYSSNARAIRIEPLLIPNQPRIHPALIARYKHGCKMYRHSKVSAKGISTNLQGQMESLPFQCQPLVVETGSTRLLIHHISGKVSPLVEAVAFEANSQSKLLKKALLKNHEGDPESTPSSELFSTPESSTADTPQFLHLRVSPHMVQK
jgi:hypothetical protein